MHNERSTFEIGNLINLIRSSDLKTIKNNFKLTSDDINKPDVDGRTAFFWACGQNKLDIAEYFIELGADLNHQDDPKWTSLHVAAAKGEIPIVYMLLSNHCEVNRVNSGLRTPLHYASSKGHLKIVELLLDYNINSRCFHNVLPNDEININATDDMGVTPLMRAVINGHTKIVKLLLEYDCNVKLKNNELNTALHFACFLSPNSVEAERKEEIAVFLLLAGADMMIKNKEGSSPIELASPSLQSTLHSISEAMLA